MTRNPHATRRILGTASRDTRGPVGQGLDTIGKQFAGLALAR